MKDTLNVGEKTLSADGNAYTWKKLTLSYVVDPHFINAKNPGKQGSADTYGAFGSLKGNTDGSFKCKAEQTFNVGKDVKLKLSKMQYRAFGNTNSADFTSKDVLECDADTNNNDSGTDNSKLGIVLGCVFGGLAVIILTAGGIWYYRKRKSRSYEHL
ncbi:uncharacterized protein LOC123555155 [Mercenaria mercenaria]|uniref:uncharacterized protein LOC123555155 n=1 Tax=Mercenaria mercenaria TaxID=6596 RepID=UPI00234F6FAD|nr:uncharacterized protein LOC123555155 [Mercenaria mercenaria]